MSDYFMVANGFVVFLLCFIVIAFVMFQAVLFMRKAWRQGLALGMSREIMWKTIRSSGIFSIIPSLPWLRLSVIGSGPYENMAANITAQSFGLTSIADQGFTLEMFVSAMWVMTIGVVWGPLYTALGSKYIQKGMNVIKGKQAGNYNDIFAVMFISMLCIFAGTYFASPFKMGETGVIGVVPLLVLVTSALFIWLMDYLVAKTKIKALQEFSFPICLIVGMASAILYTSFLS